MSNAIDEMSMEGTNLHAIGRAILKHGRFVLGPEVEEFEAAAAEIFNRRFAIGCNSGFGAHLLACLAVGFHHPKRVAVPAFAPYAFVGALERRGVIPVLIDVIKNGITIDPTHLQEQIAAPLDGVIVFSPFGVPADMEGIVKAGQSLTIIEVATSTLGIEAKSSKIGSFGVIATACLMSAGSIGTIGDAGLILTDEADLAATLRTIRQEESEAGVYDGHICGSFHQDSLQAAIALSRLDSWVESLAPVTLAAQTLAQLLSSAGVDELALVDAGGSQRYPYLVAFAENRDALHTTLRANGFPVERKWPLAIHEHPGFRHLAPGAGAFPNAELAARGIIHLPLRLSPQRLTVLVDYIRRFYRGRQ